MGDEFAGEYGLVEKDLSRGEAPICCNDSLFHVEAAIVVEL